MQKYIFFRKKREIIKQKISISRSYYIQMAHAYIILRYIGTGQSIFNKILLH